MKQPGRLRPRTAHVQSAWSIPLGTLVTLVVTSAVAHATPPCGTWSLVASPAPPTGGALYAAASLSASDAWAAAWLAALWTPVMTSRSLTSFRQQQPSSEPRERA